MGFDKPNLKTDIQTSFEDISPLKTAEDAAVQISDAIDNNFTDESPTSEAWIEVGSGGGAPAFANGWVNYGLPFTLASFFKDPFGMVHFTGLIKSGTLNTAAFTLPAGYRPTGRLRLPSGSHDSIASVDIHTSGEFRPLVGNNIAFSIDIPSFRAA